MSGPNIPDPKQLGCVLADEAKERMRSEGISRLELGAIYAEELFRNSSEDGGERS